MTNPPNLQVLLKRSSQAIQDGRRADAARILKALLKSNGSDYRVWLLLAEIAPADKKEGCLIKAEALAPGHPIIAKTRAALHLPAAPPETVVEELPPASKNLISTSPLPITAAPPSPDRSSGNISPKRFGKTGRFVLAAAITAVLAVTLAGGYWLWSIGSPSRLASGETAGTAAGAPNPNAAVDAPVVFPREDTSLQFIAQRTVEQPLPTDTPLPTATAAPTATATPDPLLPKDIVASLSIAAEWTPTPLPTNTPSPTPTVVPTAVVDNYVNVSWPAVGPNEQWVDVNLTTQTLVAYVGTTPVMEAPISSGLAPNYTVTGQFRIYYRLESQTMDGRRLGFDYVTPNVPHVQYFYGDFALHGAYWHSNFGQPMSHGCVNLSLGDAEWLYNWADYGTLVNVHY